MIKVGVTGGIGSGKSIVCHIFKQLDVPVFHADSEAKKLINTNEALKQTFRQHFGDDIYHRNGDINKAKLASIIFQNQDELDFVNRTVHPLVQKEFSLWAEKYSALPYVIEEAAILFESGAYHFFDKIITVTAPKTLRIQRVVERDNVKPEQVKARMDKQWNEAEKIKLSDFIVYNDEKQAVLPQVIHIDTVLNVTEVETFY